MTVASSTARVSYSGNGSTKTFAVNFYFLENSHIQVIIRSANGTETIKTLTTDYTVADAGNPAGGSITFGTAPTSTETVVIVRNVPLTQQTDYQANDPFPAESHEEALDKLTMLSQQVQDAVTRSIKLSKTNTMTSTEFTVGAADRANKILAFDSAGELAVSQEIGTYRGNWATSTAYQERDIIKDTSNANIYICIDAHTSTGSQPISSNADVAKWALIVDAASTTSSASAAAASASAASTSASNAASSASAASTSASNAASSASAASTSATNAANSASSAATSASDAAASYDSFDDRYLGAKSSDPSVDNDGNALIDGALYFDTTNNVMKVYDLGNTTWRRTTPTTSDQANINTVSGIAANVTTVAGISANVTTVAGISANVTTVAGISANVTSVAGNSTNINTVAGNSTNINTVAGISGNVTTVAGISADVTAVAGDATDIGTVSTNIANVNTVATNIASVNTAASDIADIIKVADDLNEAVSEIEVCANNINSIDTVGTDIANVNSVAANIANVNSVAGNSTNINSVAGNSTNINAVAGNATNINAVAAIDSEIVIAATNVADINNFADVYQGAFASPPSTRNDSSALQAGDMYFNTTDDQMKVYNGSAWQAVGSTVNGTSQRYRYIATASQTVFSGVDSNSNTLAYDVGFIDVYLNGVRLDQTDYTASNGTSITLGSAAALNDELNIVTYGNFELADHYNKTDADSRFLHIAGGDTMTGPLTLNADPTNALHAATKQYVDAETSDASNLTTGTVGTARLASGTANSTTYLRGDQTWATVSSGGATGVGASVFTSNGTFTIPANVTTVKVTVVSGGGGGGGANLPSCGNWSYGGGGGGGATAIKYLTGLTPGNTLAVTVGAAGTAGSTSGGNGGAGGTSSVASGTQSITTITCTGGAGGTGANNIAQPRAGGAGGSTSSGDININGQPGMYSSANTYTFGGGGGDSSYGSGAVLTPTAGLGNLSTGFAGTGYGAGGSGAFAAGQVGSRAGGAGTLGIVIFEY